MSNIYKNFINNIEKKNKEFKPIVKYSKTNYYEIIISKKISNLNNNDILFCGNSNHKVKQLNKNKQNYMFIPKNKITNIYKIIPTQVKTISDLISISNSNPLEYNHKYNIPLQKIHDIKPYLIELDSFIGINDLKLQILDQILYIIQDFHVGSKDYLHTILSGPPGTGKTEIAEIIGKIYGNIGILKKGSFKKVTRSDLIGGYLGQTAIKTKEIIEGCLGGVLFIDEAYALGNSDNGDSFSKECIDTLCESLSNYRENLMVIIAGYDEELEKCFFSYNQGLASRFVWKFKIEKYTALELSKILRKKINDCNWNIELSNDFLKQWIETNLIWFPNYGRDIENLITKIKISHSKRFFGKEENNKKIITELDLNNGFKIYSNNENLNLLIGKKNENTYLSYLYV
jgi:SpoVK/Ycf46/Vps4 family AAA+-type ATPase